MIRKLLRLLFGWSSEAAAEESVTAEVASADDRDQPSSAAADPAFPTDSAAAETEADLHPSLRGLDAERFTEAPVGLLVSPADPPRPAPSRSRLPRQTRRQIQEQKRAREAARRAATAERHASDIVFLGRGVSYGLADRKSDTDQLSRWTLPVLSTPKDVADALQISIPQLRWLAWHNPVATHTHYYSFEIPRRNGRPRQLSAPHRRLAIVQGWILDEILDRIPVHPSAHGFVPGRSVVSNATPHVGAHTVLNVDLSDFFPTISFPRVRGLFQSLGYSPAVATILGLLCTEAPRQELRHGDQIHKVACGPRVLPQGACTSPALSNLICHTLDRRLQGLATRLGWSYTRYADDISWSCPQEPSPPVGYVLSRIRHIVADEGFLLNDSKTRVLRRNQQQCVTGVVVNDRPAVPRKTVRRIRAILHNAQFTGLEAQNRDNHPHFEHWLLGMIGWIRMVQPETGDKLRAGFDQLQAGT